MSDESEDSSDESEKAEDEDEAKEEVDNEEDQDELLDSSNKSRKTKKNKRECMKCGEQVEEKMYEERYYVFSYACYQCYRNIYKHDLDKYEKHKRRYKDSSNTDVHMSRSDGYWKIGMSFR